MGDAMRANHCLECNSHVLKFYKFKTGNVPDLICTKKHRPRFFTPKGALDIDYGWKRICADFAPANVEGNRPPRTNAGQE